MQKEIWKDIEGFEGYYQISNLGRVKSLERLHYFVTGYGIKKEKILKELDNRGYKQVVLSINNNRKTFKIAKLVVVYFLNHNVNDKRYVIDHIDNNRSNNCANNLQIITTRLNCSKDRFRQKPTSKYTGVHWDKNRHRWSAQIYYNHTHCHLGRYKKEIDAANSYIAALEKINKGENPR